MKEFKVEEISIPNLKGKYLADYRSMRVVYGEDEFWSADCIINKTDVSIGNSINILIEPSENCDFDSLYKEGWVCFTPYLCIMAHDENSGMNYYEFYKDSSVKDVPYSMIYGRTSDKFEVGKDYAFWYKVG